MKKRVVVLYENDLDLEKVKYVFDFIFELSMCNCEVILSYEYLNDYKEKVREYDVIVNCTNTKVEHTTIHIRNNKVLNSVKSYQDVLKIKSQSYKYEDEVLYGISDQTISKNVNFIEDKIVNLDIVNTFFFHLSRIEEYYCPDNLKDKHKRMLSENQFLVKNSIERIPVLDHISAAFLKSIGLYKEVETIKVMSHDIDVLVKFPSFYKFVRGAARILFKKKKFKGSLYKFTKYYFKSLIGAPDPYKTFTWLFNESFFDKKVVFFMSGGTTQYDNLYDIKDPFLEEVFEKAKKEGYEIGLHPSYAAYNDEKQFIKEREKLEDVIGQEVVSSRQHILHYDVVATPKVLENSAIKNDYTLGFQDRIGYRTGTGFDYYLWDNSENTKYNIKETPLVIMDGCLLIEAEYSVKKAREIFKEFYRSNNKNTKITFNFHNSIFDPVLLDDIDLKQFYLEL